MVGGNEVALRTGVGVGSAIALGIAVGLGRWVGNAAGVAVAGDSGSVDAPWHAARSNVATVTISPNARLRHLINR